MSFFVPPLPAVQKPEVPTRRIHRKVDETEFNPALSEISEEGRRRRQIATKILEILKKYTLAKSTYNM